MTIQEFSDQFDVLYNNITSNQAPGLNEFEKSLFLTKAEKEIVKNYYTAQSKGNTLGQGFDDSAKRQADFSILMKTAVCTRIHLSDTTEIVYLCVSSGVNKLLDSTQLFIVNSEDNPHVLLNTTAYNVTINGETGNAEIEDPAGTTYIVKGYPFTTAGTVQGITITHTGYPGIDQIDDRSVIYSYPNDVFIAINESVKTSDNRYLQIEPLRYDVYADLMSKPFKRPLKNQAWRLMNSGNVDAEGNATKYVELVTNATDVVSKYSLRYIRVPRPIIVADLDGLTIDGESAPSTSCEIDPILHDDILQRAVELAKIAWTSTGQENIQAQMAAGQRTE